MSHLRRQLVSLYAAGFAAAVVAVDALRPAGDRALGLYGWGTVVFAAALLVRGVFNWQGSKAFMPPGGLKLREGVILVAGVVAAAFVTRRAIAGLPAANSFTALPNTPLFYIVLYIAVVAAGAGIYFGGKTLRSWALFVSLVLTGLTGQLFNLGPAGIGVVLAYVTAVFFYYGTASGENQPRYSYVAAALFLFLLAIFSTVVTSRDLGGTVKFTMMMTAGYLIFLLVAGEVQIAPTFALPPCVAAAIVATHAVTAVGLVVKFVQVLPWLTLNVPQENLFWTMGISRNALSTYAVATLPLLLWAARDARNLAFRVILWSAVIWAIVLPVVSLSKSGLAGALVVFCFVLAFWGTEGRMNLKLVLATGFLAVALGIGVLAALPGGLARFLNPLTYTTRFLMFKVVLGAFAQHPFFGLGAGSAFAWAGQTDVLSPDDLAAVPEFLLGHSHSIFLETLGTAGVVGFTALIVVLYAAGWAGSNLVKTKGGERFGTGMVVASVAGTITVLTFALGLALLAPLPFILLVSLALLEAGLRRRGRVAIAPAWAGSFFRVAVALACGAGLLQAAATSYVSRGEVSAGVGDFRAAAKAFRTAAALAPWDAPSRAKLAAALVEEGDLKGALKATRAAWARARGNASLLERAGLISWVLGDINAAERYLSLAVTYDRAGLIGGSHYPSLIVFEAARGEFHAARSLLYEAVYIHTGLPRDPSFVVYACPRRGDVLTFVRPIAGGETLRRYAMVKLGARRFPVSSLPRAVSALPGSYDRWLCLEDAYVRSFQEHFVFGRHNGGIAPWAAYRLGEGYAEARLRAARLFTEVAALRLFAPRDPAVALAVFPSPHRDVERHRWELEGLLGMALLAGRTAADEVIPMIAAEFNKKAAAVRTEVAGVGETQKERIKRLKYYYLTDEQPDWDIALADALAAAGDLPGARKFYKRAVKLLAVTGKGAGDARFGNAIHKALVATAALKGDYDDALPYVGSSTPAAFAVSANVEDYFGNYKRALITWRKAVAAFPSDTNLKLALADYYCKRGLDVRAAEVLARGDEPAVLLARAAALESAANYGAAVAVYRHLESVIPGDPLPYLFGARTLARQGDFEGAFRTMARCTLNVPTDSLITERLGALHLARGDLAKADEMFRRARHLNPYDLEAYIVWGQELCGRGRGEEALAYFAAAAEVEAGSSWAKFALADCLKSLGRDAEVRRVYEEALAGEPLGSPVSLAYDAYLAGRGDHRRRREILEKAARKDPLNALVKYRLGELLVAAGEEERGYALLVEAAVLEPASAEVNAALGFYYLMRDRPAEAVPYFEKARAAAVGDPAADRYRVLLADSYIRMGRNAEALETLAPVSDRASVAKADLLRAKAYFNLGRKEEAASFAAAALAIQPDLEEARAFLNPADIKSLEEERRESQTP